MSAQSAEPAANNQADGDAPPEQWRVEKLSKAIAAQAGSVGMPQLRSAFREFLATHKPEDNRVLAVVIDKMKSCKGKSIITYDGSSCAIDSYVVFGVL